jgi:hypothetical protein
MIEANKLNELIGEINNLRNELNIVKTKIVSIGSVVTMAGNCPSGYREANGDILLRMEQTVSMIFDYLIIVEDF